MSTQHSLADAPVPVTGSQPAARAGRLRSGHRWLAYLGSRLGQGAVVLFGAVLISFVLFNVTGSSAIARSGSALTPGQVREIERQLGYDLPLIERFFKYIGGVVQGDFGTSAAYGESALGLIVEALPYTLMIVAGAVLLALLLGVPIAILSTLRRDSLGDRVVRRSLTVVQGVPEFWLALMLSLVFSVWLRLLPSIGYDGLTSAVLPVLALALPLTPAFVRILRGQLLDVMELDFITALRAKGLTTGQIVRRHALRNAAPAFVTFIALQLGWLIGGTLIVEVVFAWPGIGSVVYNAVQYRDLIVIEAVVIVVAVGYVLLNLVADLLILWLDPRVRTGRL